MERIPFLNLYIQIQGEPVRMKCGMGEVEMLPFTGYARGILFNGTVEPGGVDVQTVDQVGMRHLYARYMLKGVDSDGADVKIYIENEAWIPDAGRKLPFHAVPRFLTDSKKLAPYLHQNRFESSVEKENGQLVIRFYDCCR